MNMIDRIFKAASVLVLFGSLLCCIAAGQVIIWALDRDAPFVMLDYSADAAVPGSASVIRAVVRRDLSRHCGVMFSRHFFDSQGVRFELGDGAQMMNSMSLDELNRRNPDSLAFSVAVPLYAAKGRGSVVTVLNYQCNPVHQLYPVPMVLNMNLEVL